MARTTRNAAEEMARKARIRLDSVLSQVRGMQTDPQHMRHTLKAHGFPPVNAHKSTSSQQRILVRHCRILARDILDRLWIWNSIMTTCESIAGEIAIPFDENHAAAGRYLTLEKNTGYLRCLFLQSLRLAARSAMDLLDTPDAAFVVKGRQLVDNLFRDQIADLAEELSDSLEDYTQAAGGKLYREIRNMMKTFRTAAYQNCLKERFKEHLADLRVLDELYETYCAEFFTGGVNRSPRTVSGIIVPSMALDSAAYATLAMLLGRFEDVGASQGGASLTTLPSVVESRSILAEFWDGVRQELLKLDKKEISPFASSGVEFINFDMEPKFLAMIERERLQQKATKKPVEPVEPLEDPADDIGFIHNEEDPAPGRKKRTKAKAKRLNADVSTDDKELETLQEDTEEQNKEEPEILKIAIPRDSLAILQRMYSNEGTIYGNVSWNQVLAALSHAGLNRHKGGKTAGAALSFTDGVRTVSLHRPHDGIVQSHMLRNMGKYLTDALAWNRETFELKKKDRPICGK